LVILKNPEQYDELKDYITGVVGHFRTDQRVHAWDLFNEPDNANRSSYGRFEPASKAGLALMLLKKEFTWARSVDPHQPLTVGVWAGDLTSPEQLLSIYRFILEQSDVISFHTVPSRLSTSSPSQERECRTELLTLRSMTAG